MKIKRCINGHKKTKGNLTKDNRCKTCRLEQRRKWGEKNKDKVKKLYDDWCEKNSSRSNEIKKNWADKNKNKIAISGKKYRDKNKDKLKTYRKQKHIHEKRMHRKHSRRTLIKNTTTEIIRIHDLHKIANGICYLCKQKIDLSIKHPDPLSASQEHIIPIIKKGTHTPENVTITHLRCNLKKGSSQGVNHE